MALSIPLFNLEIDNSSTLISVLNYINNYTHTGLKEQCHPEVSWLLVPQELPKFPGGGEGATVLSVTLYPNYHHHHLAHHHPPPGPCCMCELLGWFHSRGLVIKQVTISPTGVRCFTSLQGACNLSLITHLTIRSFLVGRPGAFWRD